MNIINFTISESLNKQIKTSIKKYGFISKAEFFRFLLVNFFRSETNKNNLSLPLENNQEIAKILNKIEKTTKEKINNKKIPTIREQLSDLI